MTGPGSLGKGITAEGQRGTFLLKLLKHYKIDSHKSIIGNVHINMNAFDMLLVPDVQVSMPNGVC